MEERSSLIIADDVNLTDTEIIIGKGSKLTIGRGSVLKGKINIGSFSSVEIGSNLSVTSSLYIRVVEKTGVKIGDDCLIATGVTIRTNDGHPIYDTISGERINKSQDITIGNHVWLGDEATILKGVNIGDGSIVAMRSIVTKSVESKVIVAGIPARVVRENCTWEHDLKSKTEHLYL
ncbi:hypothetical protein B1L08_00910 [Aeromonas veronii]|nr:hypothetical protein [Aeromonas veronii]